MILIPRNKAVFYLSFFSKNQYVCYVHFCDVHVAQEILRL